ncbi:hypothetical protein [Chitinophaga pinensis]|uniref:Uncharacterized protein n=1 Tax=Chitinophaga pinensis (strain ATCC 43595 / DSM 2588 / LMG 13176 / NBRC 15968 / NCIMB 11800 / UQM 2034) TaxID=485918 RepID=A0A979GC28_CHIPD|nr:hypothetical protein [Chitinophaga pinensis]ACU64557.1 hypothetical protein Cpin_7156 [Chitinophaga pinensis DSM 2588]
MFKTLSQLGDFVDPATIITGAVLYGIGALLLTLILLIVFRKRVLVPRKYTALRILAYSYFVILPLLAGFFGMKWGFFNGLRKDIKAHTSVYIEHIPSSIDAKTSAAVSNYLRDNNASLSNLTTDQLIDAVAEVIYTQYDSLLAQQQTLQQGSNVILPWLLKLTKGKGMAQFAKHTIHKLLKEKLGLDEDVSKELMASRIDEVLRTGLFAKIAMIQVDHFLKSIQKGILITLCLLMAIPLVEITIAHYLLKKKKATPQPQPAMSQV